ncbi:MAG: folate family ECF transporter S component [Lachnospiraceae bacterium]|nr:folate family ECF transporter S component [Lachnospiraceae bacterium]
MSERVNEKKRSVFIGGLKKFSESSREMSKPLNLAITAMMLALSVVLGYLSNMSIPFLGTNTIKIGFDVFPIIIIAVMFGPVPAGIAGGLRDIIGYLLAPMGAYIPGFTISYILIGMIYGVAFYKEKMTLKRIIVTELIVTVFINLFLGVLWFRVFYGMPIDKAFKIRGLKEIVDVPFSIIVTYFGYKLLHKVPEFRRANKKNA